MIATASNGISTPNAGNNGHCFISLKTVQVDMNGSFCTVLVAGFNIKQATVLATAIPDIEPPLERLRAELRGKIQDLRANMERRLNTQTWTAGRSWSPAGHQPVELSIGSAGPVRRTGPGSGRSCWNREAT